MQVEGWTLDVEVKNLMCSPGSGSWHKQELMNARHLCVNRSSTARN